MRPHRIAALLVAAALAAASADAAERRVLTPQDLWAIKRLGSPELSPDGKTVVFTQQEWSIEKNASTTSLWLADVQTGALRRLTTAQANDGSPVWSPDGTRIAFTAKRGEDAATALYVIHLGGGEAEKVLELPTAVSTPRWMPDGRAIVVSTTVVPALAGAMTPADLAAMRAELKRRRDSTMTAKVTENRQYRYFDRYLTDNLASRLVLVDVAAKSVRDLTPGVTRLFDNSGEVRYDISPDGKTIALEYNSTPPPFRDFLNPDLYLLPTDGSGTMTNVTPENVGADGSPVWTPDGRSVFFKRLETPYYSGEFAKLWRHDLASGRNVPVTDALDFWIDDLRVSDDGKTLWLTAEDRGVVPVFRASADGSGMTAVHREGTSTVLREARGTVVFLNDTTSRPNELFVLDAATGRARQLTRVNEPLMAQIELGAVESYWFKGAGGDDVHGWLVLPPGFDRTKTYPFVQLLHGGPHTMNRDSWSYRWNTQVFAATGCVVTWVNRHGSTGFGEAFSRSIVNAWGVKPFEDVMAGTDYVLSRYPNIDPQRIAAAGASYGGYMAAWILGHTDRFKAIIDHAGVNNSYSQFATDVPHGFAMVMGGTPWGDVDGMQRHNPMFYARNFRTPTLVIHGELDYRVPYGNGLELYGVLQAQGVPSRLVVFPDENHWVLKPQNAISWHWEMQHWLSRHIGATPTLEKPDVDRPVPETATAAAGKSGGR
jgi:dipeptidyl aminopeptidase/acylaminoacyl peptidase